MKANFIKNLELYKDSNEFIKIKKAIQKTFSRHIYVGKLIATKEGLLFWAHYNRTKALREEFKLKTPKLADKMLLISKIVIETVNTSKSKGNEQLVALVNSIYSKTPYAGSKHYLRYAYRFFSNILSKEYDHPILPQMLLRALPKIFPGTDPPKGLSTWTDIEEWATQLRESGYHVEYMGKNGRYDDSIVQQARKQIAAANIVYDAYVLLHKKKTQDSALLDWDWCPLCWRPVENSTGREPCKLHQLKTPDYYKILRVLRKMRQNGEYEPILGVADKIPIKKYQQYRDITIPAFRVGFPQGWKYFPNILRYLLKQNPKPNLWSLDDCIEALSPGALQLFEAGAIKTLPFVVPAQKQNTGHEFIITGLKQTLLSRAETWLYLESTIKKGGVRKNAGRPPKQPETKRERNKRLRENSKMLQAKREKRKSDLKAPDQTPGS